MVHHAWATWGTEHGRFGAWGEPRQHLESSLKGVKVSTNKGRGQNAFGGWSLLAFLLFVCTSHYSLTYNNSEIRRSRCYWAHQTALFFSWISPSFKWEPDVLSATDVLLLLVHTTWDFLNLAVLKRHGIATEICFYKARLPLINWNNLYQCI